MKKVTALILFFVMIFTFTACGAKEKATAKPKLNTGFTCDAAIEYGDMKAEATIQRLGNAAWEVTFTSPDTLSGVKLSFLDDNVTASYKGLSFSIPKSALPLKSMLSNLIEAVDSAAGRSEIEGIVKDGNISVDGKTEQGDYTMTLDSKDGILISFEMPNLELKMTFANFSQGGSKPEGTTTAVTTTVSGDTTKAGTGTTKADSKVTKAETKTTKAEPKTTTTKES